MAFEWDVEDRAAFRAQIEATVRAAFGDAELSWIEYDRRLMVSWPDIGSGSIWEPNFFFSRGSIEDAYLLKQITDHLAGQRADLASKTENT
jgi:hypothetical protein